MLRCFSTLGCPALSLDAVLALARRHAIDAVEIRALGGTTELTKYFAENFGKPAALAAQLRDEPVQIVAFGTSLHLAGGTTAQRDELRALVPWAEALGVRWLRVFDGKGAAEENAALAEMAATVRWWREQRAAGGWRTDCMVETHDRLFTPHAIERFVAAAPETKILWDAHHTWRKAGADPVEMWRAIRPHVAHVHVKDSVPVPSARHPFTYTLPGDGGFPMAGLRAALATDGFAGAVSLEWEKWWHPYLPPLEEALHAADERGWF